MNHVELANKILLLKEQESLYTLLKNLFLKLGIALVVIIIYDLFLYFGANKILSFFLFLLKWFNFFNLLGIIL